MDDQHDAQLFEALKSVNLEKYYDSFISHGFNLNNFYKLSVKDFKDLGMNDLQDRQALYKLRTMLRANSVAQARTFASPPTSYLNSPMPVPQSTHVVPLSGLPSGLSPAPIRSVIPKSPFSITAQSPPTTVSSLINSPSYKMSSPIASPPSMTSPRYVETPSLVPHESPKFSQSPMPPPQFQLNDSSLTVAVRKRPLNQKELSRGDGDQITCTFNELFFEEQRTAVDLTIQTITHPFTFDRVYNENDDNFLIYRECVYPLVQEFLTGSNATIFAYGQTGSGKTYTMLDSNTGMCALCANDIFATISRAVGSAYSLKVSFFELYNNHINDLFNNRSELNLFEDATGLHIPNLTTVTVDSTVSLTDLISQGSLLRTVGITAQNDHSSRSHAVITLTLMDGFNEVSSIKFIDLAGSERAADVKDSGRSTQGEGAAINSSLLAFKECVRALAKKQTRIPFRTSKLTMLLRDVFVGYSRSTMIATVSPATRSSLDTLNTLKYAETIRSALTDETSRSAPHNDRTIRVEPSYTSSTKLASPAKVPEPVITRRQSDIEALAIVHDEFINNIYNSLNYDRSILANAKNGNISVDKYINSMSESFGAKLNAMAKLKEIIDSYKNSQ